MLRPLLIGLVAGMRSMTPLAAVSLASRAGRLPAGNGAPEVLGRPLVAAGCAVLAIGELFGDKMASAPDRIIASGVAARLVTGAIAGAALARKDQRPVAMAVGAAAAVAAAYVSFDLRMRALRRYGQTPSGLAEDAIALLGALVIVGTADLD